MNEAMEKYLGARWGRCLDRFWAKVEKSDGCWTWRGTLSNRSGWTIGVFSVDHVQCPAHRFAYEVSVGIIPAGLVIDHRCNNPICVRPDHLAAVTQKENVLRGRSEAAQNARKTHCKRGHPFDEVNTYNWPRPNGGAHRMCRTCLRERQQRLRNARRAA